SQSLLPRRIGRLLPARPVAHVLVRAGGFRRDPRLRVAQHAAAGDAAGEGTAMSSTVKKVGIVGARGHTGAELIRLVAAHPSLELAFVSSRELDGQRVDAHVPEYRGELRYSAPAHEELPTLGADVVILALPNGKAAACVEAFDQAG